MDHKWGRTCAEILGYWPRQPPTLGIAVPATLASRILEPGWSGWYLLNVKNGTRPMAMKLNAVTQRWDIGSITPKPGVHLHFPYGYGVEADGPV